MSPSNHLANYSAYLQLMRVHRPIETVQETLARHVLPVENPYGVGYFTGFLLSQERRMLVFCTVPIGTFLLLWPMENPYGVGYFTGFLLSRLCKKPIFVVPARETVQETSLGYAGGKPNLLNPPYQGDFPLNSPLIRGARGVKNDERWVSCTVSFAGTTDAGFLHSPDWHVSAIMADLMGFVARWQRTARADYRTACQKTATGLPSTRSTVNRTMDHP